MAIKFNTDKVSSFLQKAKEAGKSVAESAGKSAAAISEKVKDASYQERLKKYNPLFSDEYTAVSFVLPRLITIVDEAVRRGVDVCEGAIGWRSVQAETEVLHLYNTSTELKEIEFYPAATSGATYYVDNFNPNRYIDVEYIFNKAHDERLAELKQIAYALGAKSCTIEITETKQDANAVNANGKVGFGKLGISADKSTSSASSQMRSGKITATFKGSVAPQRPALKWFVDDDNIKSLIELRCTDPDRLEREELILSGSTFATISHSAAAAIDGLHKSKDGISMKDKATKECSSLLIFSVEF